jgi:predicted nucleotidyltransferase
MDKRDALEITTDYIKYLISEKNFRINRAFLFGSYAKDRPNSDSDIDIAIVIPNVADIIEMQIQLMVLRRNFSIDIEPHPINESDFNTSNPLACEILKTGIELKIIDLI